MSMERAKAHLQKKGFAGLTEGTVYPLLQRLEKQGLLQSEWRSSGIGPQRKYYALTQEGHQAVTVFVQNWEKMQTAVTAVLRGEKPKTNPAGNSLLVRSGETQKKRRGFSSF